MNEQELEQLKIAAKVDVVKNILIEKEIVSEAEMNSAINLFIRKAVGEEQYKALDDANKLA
ncbi:hypothetical protein [Kurthia massiliensis]|uniref:hypothetical protein n=1 Tax=Kurthia massiliensis TaxID=1033739 RepID=UPI000288D9EE|nr:hypothetical protein [Kurthia massiliensis]